MGSTGDNSTLAVGDGRRHSKSGVYPGGLDVVALNASAGAVGGSEKSPACRPKGSERSWDRRPTFSICSRPSSDCSVSPTCQPSTPVLSVASRCPLALLGVTTVGGDGRAWPFVEGRCDLKRKQPHDRRRPIGEGAPTVAYQLPATRRRFGRRCDGGLGTIGATVPALVKQHNSMDVLDLEGRPLFSTVRVSRNKHNPMDVLRRPNSPARRLLPRSTRGP